MLLSRYICIFIGMSVSLVAASPPNLALVIDFVNCLSIHNTTNYGYNVTADGGLILAPLDENLGATSKSAYSVCNRLFGIGFDCVFARNTAKYMPDIEFRNIEDMTAEGLISAGLAGRVPLAPPASREEYEGRLHNLAVIGNGMGFSNAEIAKITGITDLLNKTTAQLGNHQNICQIHASDESYIWGNASYGQCYKSPCYKHFDAFKPA